MNQQDEDTYFRIMAEMIPMCQTVKLIQKCYRDLIYRDLMYLETLNTQQIDESIQMCRIISTREFERVEKEIRAELLKIKNT